MATVLNTLFPPEVASFMPSFRYDQEATIWFNISSYNEDIKDNIKFIHVSMVDQRNNQNVFAGLNGLNTVYPSLYPVKVTSWDDLYDEEKQAYKITIPPSVVKTKPFFNPGQYYKVQLRFDLTGSSDHLGSLESADPTELFSDPFKLTSYLTNNQDNFSEWSTGTLIKAILVPHMDLVFDRNSTAADPNYTVSEEDLTSNEKTGDEVNKENLTFGYLKKYEGENKEDLDIKMIGVLPSTDSSLVGQLYFEKAEGDETSPTDDTEWMTSYQISLWDWDRTTCLSTTGKVLTETGVGSNQINTTIDVSPFGGQTGYNLLKLEYETNNGYSYSAWYIFTVGEYEKDTADNTIVEVSLDDDLGKVTLNISGLENYTSANGYIVVRRSSHKTEFKEWELIEARKVAGLSSISVLDTTIESLSGYKYQVQYIDDDTIYKPILANGEIISCDFYGILLSRQEKMVKLAFDGQITQVSNATRRTKVDTLGGRYPRFTQNGRLNYRTYSISGKISSQDITNAVQQLTIDESINNSANTFMTRKDAVGEEYYNQRYAKIHDSHTNISLDNDWLYEREYRDKLNEWLDDGSPKLFRSMTEGNLAVMLDSITLTPDKTLGRRLYSFSATMYEVGDGRDLDSLTSLGILNRVDER